MGVKAARPPAPITAATMAQIAADNEVAQGALSKRSQALASVTKAVDEKLASDSSVSAYPHAKQRLEEIKAVAHNGQAVISKEKEIRSRLASAAGSGDRAGVRQAQADLADLKKSNPKIFGKSSTASPIMKCPSKISSNTCDNAISNVRYRDNKGPGSPRSPKNPCYGTSLAEWSGWDEMIAHGCATAEERDMITAMSENEGSFEAVQSYDSKALTFGAMQKTMDTSGKGEFTQQLAAFKKKDPAGFKRLFADHGWTVEGGKTYYQDAAGTKRTGSELKTYLRSAEPADQVKALAPLRSAGRDPAFRKQQICDFIVRAHQASDRRVKVGIDKYPAGDFVTSTQGKAMLLDTSVNAGRYEKSFQETIDWFYKTHPDAGKDPSAWTVEERQRNEAAIVGRYAATRSVAAERRKRRNDALVKLPTTADPNGLASDRPRRNCPDCA